MIKIKDASMKDYCSFKCGGKAKMLCIPQNISELKDILNEVKDENYFIMGNGTNTLVKDGGFNGTIIKIGDSFNSIEVNDTKLIVGSGALLSTVSKKACENSLTGLEFACGIPGSVGGAVYINAGAYGGEMKDIVESIEVLTLDGNIKRYTNKELDFDYRYSKLKETKDIVLKVTLNLSKGNKEDIKNKMKELMKKRNEKQPINYPSAGSVFKRPEGYFAGKLIEDANLKGFSIGDAMVSTLHAGFIINKGKCRSTDVINLIEKVKETVYEKFKVSLEEEIIIIGDD